MTGVNIYQILGPKVDKNFFDVLEKEGIVFDSKKVWLTFRAKDFKGKGVLASSIIRLSRGQLIISKKRFVAIAGGHKIIDAPVDYPFYKKIVFDKSNPKRFIVNLNMADFGGKFSGNISLGYHIDPTKIKN